jgi:hypothetical protein
MMRIWDGDPNEYFTHVDMNRVEYNANIVARECGVQAVSFLETTRASQFRYDEANKLEALILACAQSRGQSPAMETSWSYTRTVSYVDFERWESALWDVYEDLGGVGERIPSDKFLHTVSATLFASGWMGAGPYYQDLDVPMIYADSDAVIYVDYRADLVQRMTEINSMLRPETISDRRVRIHALSIRPTVNIPIRISMGGLQMQEVLNLPAASWQGTGPWTQTVTLSKVPTDAVLGVHEGMTDAQVEAMTIASISAAGINGTSLTVRAIFKKPTIDIPIGIIYNTTTVN